MKTNINDRIKYMRFKNDILKFIQYQLNKDGTHNLL